MALWEKYLGPKSVRPPKLYDFQETALGNVMDAIRGGKKRILVHAPPGFGKTLLFGAISKEFIGERPSGIIIVTNRTEIQEQARDWMQRFFPSITPMMIGGTYTDSPKGVIDIVSVAMRSKIGEISSIKYRIVFIDEAHHYMADEYRSFLSNIQRDITIGVTATPWREDKKSLRQLFDVTAYSTDISTLVKRGRLARPISLRIHVPDGTDEDGRDEIIVRTYLDRFSNKQALVFVDTIEHANEIHRRFEDNGIDSAVVVGTTKKDERLRIVNRYRSGMLRVLINVEVFTEGTDLPIAEVALMGRRTESRLFYVQSSGRVMRDNRGKKSKCYIVDFIDEPYKAKYITASTLIGRVGLRGNEGEELDLVALDDGIRKYSEKDPERVPLYENARTPIDLEIISEIEIEQSTKIPWNTEWPWAYNIAGKCFFVQSESKLAVVVYPEGGRYRVMIINGRGETVKKVVATPTDINDVMKAVEWETCSEFHDSFGTENWRDRPASDAQIKMMTKKGVKSAKYMTKGEASVKLSEVMPWCPPGRLKFGKAHFGKPFSEIPDHFFEWMIDKLGLNRTLDIVGEAGQERVILIYDRQFQKPVMTAAW